MSEVLKYGNLEIPLDEFSEFIAGLQIDLIRLDELAQDHPANRARVALAAEKAKAMALKAKAELKTIYYQLYTEYKEGSEKKLTEEHLKAKIYTDKRYIKANMKYLEMEEKANLLVALRDSVDSFGRMLFLLGENKERTF